MCISVSCPRTVKICLPGATGGKLEPHSDGGILTAAGKICFFCHFIAMK